MCIYLYKCERQCLNTVLTNYLCKMIISTKKNIKKQFDNMQYSTNRYFKPAS